MRTNTKPGTLAKVWEQNELSRRNAKATTVRPIELSEKHRIADDLSIPEWLRRSK